MNYTQWKEIWKDENGWDNFIKKNKIADENFKEFLGTVSDAKFDMKDYQQWLIENGKSTSIFTNFTKKAGIALKSLSAAMASMAINWAIGKVIDVAATGIDNLIHSAEKCKERVDELMSSYQSALSEANSNAQTVEELADKYEKLSKGVNNLGENVSLTTDEYAEYNKIVNQIADMFPNLIQGYTNEGNAILSLKGNIEELRDAYKDAQQEAYNMLIVSGKDSDGNDIVENFQNTWGSKSFFNDIFKGSLSSEEHVEIITSFYDAMLESDEAYEKLYKYMIKGSGLWDNYHLTGFQANEIKKVLKEIGFTSSLSDEDKKNIANNARSYIQTYQAEVDSALKNVQTLANAYLMTNEDYAFLDEQSQNAASIIVNSINENIASGFTKSEDVGSYVAKIVDTLKTNPEARNALVGLFTDDLSELSPQQAKEVVDQYIECIAKALGADELELKVQLGFEDVDTIAENYNAVMRSAAEKFSGVTPQYGTHIPVTQEEKELFKQEKAALEAFAEENSINTQDEIAFWNQCIEESETKEEAMEKYLASAFTNLEDDTLVPTITSSISQIATQLEPQFTELGKLYNEIFQTDDNGNEIFSLDSIDNAALESLRKSFADIGEEIGVTFDPEKLEPFFAVLTDGNSTADEVQQAFNDLATAYLYSTGTLEQLNNETASAIEKQLAQMGVTNAEAVVAEALALKNEELALSKKYLAQTGKELASATDSEVLAFMAEQAEAGNCGSALAALQLQKLLVNGTLLDTEADINNIMRLANAAGIATETLSELIRWKAIYENAEANGHSLMSSLAADHIEALKQNFQDEVNSFKFKPVDVEYKVSDSSKSSSSSAAEQAETDWKNLLDKETDLLEKQLAANIITFKEYTDKRRQIIEDYYRDGKIKAEDYYDALEDMYDHQLSLYDRVVNAVTDRIDDEIDKLKDQKEAIENSYQIKIDAIQEEIDALTKANDARQKQIDLEKAQYEAERARNQRVNKVKYMPLSAVMRFAKSNYIG